MSIIEKNMDNDIKTWLYDVLQSIKVNVSYFQEKDCSILATRKA